MNELVSFEADLDPFAWEPGHASRIQGLGGTQPAAEGAYTFQTAYLAAPAGLVTITIVFEELRATRGTLLIEVSGGEASAKRQLRLRTLSLAALAEAGGAEEIVLASDRREIYSVAGYIYDESDAIARALAVRMVVAPAGEGGEAPEAGGMARVGRLTSIAMPSFAHPSSQTWSPAQGKEQAFRVACARLGVPAGVDSWPAAIVYQAIGYGVGAAGSLRGLGAGVAPGPIAAALTAFGAEVACSPGADTADWQNVSDADFAWLILDEPEPLPPVSAMAGALLDRVRPGGTLVLVFPFEHGRLHHEPCPAMTRGSVEVLALKLLAQGHGVAQLKFRAGSRPLRSGTRTAFALIVRRGA